MLLRQDDHCSTIPPTPVKASPAFPLYLPYWRRYLSWREKTQGVLVKKKKNSFKPKKKIQMCFSYSLIGDPKVLIICMVFVTIPVHEINLHKVPTCRTNKEMISIFWRNNQPNADFLKSIGDVRTYLFVEEDLLGGESVCAHSRARTHHSTA